MRVEISTKAKADIHRVGDRILNENPVRALSFIDELLSECLSLAYMPERYPVYKVTDVGELRRKNYGNYLIFYVVQAECVTIARVLHGAQDYADLF